jgi:molybdopterin-synthase adenylyltransferase
MNRYDRQRLIEGWNQTRLHNARILVAGVGALGNETLKNLALLGIGELIFVDFDKVESSNLSRTVLFTENDIGKFKVDAAASALRRLNPEVQVVGINGDLFNDVGVGYYRHIDLVIGCLDNLAARAQVGKCACLAGIPYLDGGLWSFGGEVRWFMGKDGPCFECTLTADDLFRAEQRRSCSGFREEEINPEYMPTVITASAIIGGILAQEAVRWLHGYPVQEGKALVYNGQSLTLHRAELERNPDCHTNHFPYEGVIELPEPVFAVTPHFLFNYAREKLNASDELILHLGRDFLVKLKCPQCAHEQDILEQWTKVPAAAQICPKCGALRQPNVITTLSEMDRPYIDWSLARLGIPAAEVVAVHSKENLYLFELASEPTTS